MYFAPTHSHLFPILLKTMYLNLLLLTLLSALLPTLIADQCPECDSYIAALKTCQTTSANISAVGTTINTQSTHCMCVSDSSFGEMTDCQICEDPDLSTDFDIELLGSWAVTCNADNYFGDQQAVLCWEAQPLDLPEQCLGDTGRLGTGTAILGAAGSTTGTMTATGMIGSTTATGIAEGRTGIDTITKTAAATSSTSSKTASTKSQPSSTTR